MRKAKKYHTQKGLTLVEVLAALVILGIVFIGFMTIFPQMSLVNEKTETKLDTMNLAREEMAKLTGQTYTQTDLVNLTGAFTSILNGGNNNEPYTVTKISETTETNIYEVKNINSDFIYNVNVQKVQELEGTISLFKVTLQIYTGGTNPNSETYGYLQVNTD